MAGSHRAAWPLATTLAEASGGHAGPICWQFLGFLWGWGILNVDNHPICHLPFTCLLGPMSQKCNLCCPPVHPSASSWPDVCVLASETCSYSRVTSKLSPVPSIWSRHMYFIFFERSKEWSDFIYDYSRLHPGFLFEMPLPPGTQFPQMQEAYSASLILFHYCFIPANKIPCLLTTVFLCIQESV